MFVLKHQSYYVIWSLLSTYNVKLWIRCSTYFCLFERFNLSKSIMILDLFKMAKLMSIYFTSKNIYTLIRCRIFLRLFLLYLGFILSLRNFMKLCSSNFMGFFTFFCTFRRFYAIYYLSFLTISFHKIHNDYGFWEIESLNKSTVAH